jgi:hypothetical protein
MKGQVAMPLRASEPDPDWWDDELDALLKQCVAVFGEDATDDIVVRWTERHFEQTVVDDLPVRDALVPMLVEAIKAECRRLLRPH